MRRRLLVVMALAVLLAPTLAEADRYLYMDPPGATQFVLERIRVHEQHTIYLEVVTRGNRATLTGKDFAAIVGLVKICFVPDGFITAIAASSGIAGLDQLEEMYRKDRQCGGCIFTYDFSRDESYYVTDPNGIHWVIDRYQFNTTANGAKDRQAFVVHLQVDPVDSEPFRDAAPWRWRDKVANGFVEGPVRDGAPRFENTDEEGNRVDKDHWCRTAPRCAIEYVFLFYLCDTVIDSGFHLHDGSQTIQH